MEVDVLRLQPHLPPDDSALANSPVVSHMRLHSKLNEPQCSKKYNEQAILCSLHFTMVMANLEGLTQVCRGLHLHDSALALCSAVSYIFIQPTHNLFELHSS